MFEEFLDSLKRAGVHEITIKFNRTDDSNNLNESSEIVTSSTFPTGSQKRRELEIPPEMMSGDL